MQSDNKISLWIIVGSLIIGGFIYLSFGSSKTQSNKPPDDLGSILLTSGLLNFDNQKCLIKGNISSSGEKIYHIPSGQFYDRTVITESKGERWFCTEAEARAAGWRKSSR